MKFIQIIETLFISLIAAYLITPFIKRMAHALNYLDHPTGNKIHARPTPLLGGVSIFIAFIIATMAKSPTVLSTPVKAILFGSLILLVIGLIDDKLGMMPNFKLFGQFVAAMVAIKSGLRIGFLDNYYLSVIFTYIWIIGITNSFNLLDNMNGLSAGIAGICATFFGIIAFSNGQFEVSILSFALAGSAFGFLKHNFPKARIFMGDSGSLVLGYVLSTLAIMISWNVKILSMSIIVPLFVLGYPIFDTALVSIMRIAQRRSIFQGGKDHSSHMLSLLGFKRFRTVLAVYAICILLGLVAIAITNLYWTSGAILSSATLIIMMILGIRLGFVHSRRFGSGKKRRD
ncbi:MAG: MraY family glycosyltransferase [Candidatus Omnitrophota bacterium]